MEVRARKTKAGDRSPASVQLCAAVRRPLARNHQTLEARVPRRMRRTASPWVRAKSLRSECLLARRTRGSWNRRPSLYRCSWMHPHRRGVSDENGSPLHPLSLDGVRERVSHLAALRPRARKCQSALSPALSNSGGSSHPTKSCVSTRCKACQSCQCATGRVNTMKQQGAQLMRGAVPSLPEIPEHRRETSRLKSPSPRKSL